MHENAAREAAVQGARAICFQELFYGPFFCQVQDTDFYTFAEAVPDGPTVRRFSALAKELGMVMVLPVYEEEQPGVLDNTAAVVDADGSLLGKYRKSHIPNLHGFWEKFYFRPGNLGYPDFDTAVGRVGVYICCDRHFPEGWCAPGLNGAEIVFNPPDLAPRPWVAELAVRDLDVEVIRECVTAGRSTATVVRRPTATSRLSERQARVTAYNGRTV